MRRFSRCRAAFRWKFVRPSAARPAESAFSGPISTRSLSSVYRIDQIIEAIRLLRDRGLRLLAHRRRDGFRAGGTGVAGAAARIERERSVHRLDFRMRQNRRPFSLSTTRYIAAINTDGVSASLLEAMAVGLLPIVPDNPANRNWIDPGHTGLLYCGGDAGGNCRCGCPSCRRPRPARARRHNQPSAGLRARGPARQLAALPRPLRPNRSARKPRVGHGSPHALLRPANNLQVVDRAGLEFYLNRVNSRALARRRTARSRPARVAAAPARSTPHLRLPACPRNQRRRLRAGAAAGSSLAALHPALHQPAGRCRGGLRRGVLI